MRQRILLFTFLASFNVSGDEYNRFEKSTLSEYRNFEKEIIKLWDGYSESSQKIYVEYSNSHNLKVIIDFEKGVLTFTQNKINLPEQKKMIESLVSKKLINKSDANRFSKIVEINSSLIRLFNFSKDHIMDRAKEYLDVASNYAKELGQKISLVLGITEAESAFNPKAVSHAGAVGMMQIVPTSAGRDVMNNAFNKDIVPNFQELIDPNTNLYFGTYYLKMLGEKLDDLKLSAAEKEEAIIASYNCGAGRVTTLIEKYGVKDYQKYLPLETKNYLVRVKENMKHFEN